MRYIFLLGFGLNVNASLMRAVQDWELWAVPIALITAFFSSLVVEFHWLSQLTAFRILKYGGVAYSGWNFWRALNLSKPFVMKVTPNSWTNRGTAALSETERLDLFVLVTQKVHRKGKYPSVQILKSPHDAAFGTIDYSIDENGDVFLHHPASQFNPYQLKEFTVKIEV